MNTLPMAENEEIEDITDNTLEGNLEDFVPQPEQAVSGGMGEDRILAADTTVLRSALEQDDESMRKGLVWDGKLREPGSILSVLNMGVDGGIVGESGIPAEIDTVPEPKIGGMIGEYVSLEVKSADHDAPRKLGADGNTRKCGTILEVNAAQKPALELRRKIWKLLLFNPKLGNVQQGSEWLISEEAYDLSPEILRTCQNIYFEASEILYSCNTFFFVGVSQYDGDHFQGIFQRCPITRYSTTTKRFKTQKVWSRYILTMQKVRRWKIIIGTVELSSTWGRCNLSPFCREICNAPLPPTSLEIIVMSEEGTGAIPVPVYLIKTVKRLKSAVELVQALRNLRNIGELRFANAKPTDCPRFYDHFSENIIYREVDYVTKDTLHHPIPLLLQAELQALVTGNSPVELLCNMNQCLLNYAKTYERFNPYRKEMGRNRVHRGDSLYELTRRVKLGPKKPADRRIISPTEIWLNPYWPHNYHKLQHHLRHPVEVGLDKCNTAADDNDAVTFKRREIYTFSSENTNINMAYSTLIEREPSSDLISQGYCDSTMEEQAANDCVLLEAYADTFKRGQTFATKAMIARMRAEFDGYYNSMPREIAIQQAMQAIQNSQDRCNYDVWADNFIIAFDDMENQFEEIQEARREIYSWDISSYLNNDIDVQLG
ncbi:hypothetical protein BCON_0197g00150 [Botryotinia convoluta]|uniref:Uncharacterized protein n=1 Tax=Botryotinia convoluta TaxID=54673 RepID=A0A4Z1HYM2_9HELO|nr:hypothetical protein BCON_0197g00150 [Botryotinia convoluta]